MDGNPDQEPGIECTRQAVPSPTALHTPICQLLPTNIYCFNPEHSEWNTMAAQSATVSQCESRLSKKIATEKIKVESFKIEAHREALRDVPV